MATHAKKRKDFDQPFNSRIPPMFRKGGLLHKYKQHEIGARLAVMVEMPEEHSSVRIWRGLYTLARRAMEELCFMERRTPTWAELSQLEWLQEAGHQLWMEDKVRRRTSLAYIEELEKQIKELTNGKM